MLDRTFISMKTSITLIILTILHTKVDSADIDDIGNILSDKEQMWNEAFNACQTNNSRLPTLQVVNGNDFVLETQIHTDVDKCFWLGAMYEYNTQDISGEFPIDSCESVRKLGDKYIYDWQNCGTNLTFLCAADDTTASANTINREYLTWSQASKRCHDQNVFLPSKNNSVYLDRITVESLYWWLNSTRHRNLSPSYAKYGDTPLCLCQQEFRDIQCPADTKTICFPYDSGLHIRTTSSIPKSGQPLETSHSTPTVIVTSISAKSTDQMPNVTTSAYSRSEGFTKKTNLSSGSTSTKVMTNLTTSAYSRTQDLTKTTNLSSGSISTKVMTNVTTSAYSRSQDLTKTTNVSSVSDNSALIGGVTGASVFLIAFVIVTIIIIKLIRRKRRAEDDMKLKKLDAKPTENNLTIFETNYNVDAILKSFPDSQTFPSESESYEQGKLNAISINKKDDKNVNINSDAPLYSQVQKSQGKKFDAEKTDTCYGSTNIYDKIIFEKKSAGKTSGNVYEKAEIHNRYSNGEIHENLYDKADHSFNGLGHNGRIAYDNNPYDTTTLSDTVTDLTYDHV